MDSELLNFLLCPSCSSDLAISEGKDENGAVLEGSLECQGCSLTYDVRNGIPRFFAPQAGHPNPKSASDRVDLTVSNYSDYQGEQYAPLADLLDNEEILFGRTGLKGSDFAGKICLDAGCGIGRFSRFMASSGAQRVIALDAGDSIDAAKAQSDPDLPISFIQGHILNPPIRTDCIDRTISIGVLHHTSDPERGFQKLAETVKTGGSLSVYLYNISYQSWDRIPRFPFWQIRFSLYVEPVRRLIVRLPKPIRLSFCKLLYKIRTKILEPLKQQGRVGRIASQFLEYIVPPDVYKPLENAHSNITRNFDVYSTPYNYCHELEELLTWFTREGTFQDLVITPYRLSISGRKSEPGTENDPVQITYFPPRSIQELESRGVQEQSDNTGPLGER